MYENELQLLRDMDHFGIKLRPSDRPLDWVNEGRKTCGKGGKFWVNLHSFAPKGTNKRYIVGAFGSYKDKSLCKVEWDRESLTDELREQYRREREAARDRERREAEEAAANAALSATVLWQRASRTGASDYLRRKGVEPESCRYVVDWLRIKRRDPREKPITLQPGTLVLPLIRYDLPREEALRGLQFIKPDGFKLYTEGFGKKGCCIRLGEVESGHELLLVCEGYATGLTIRMAIDRELPVFVAMDAGNLEIVVPLLRELYPTTSILVCADDDWKTSNHEGANPGRTAARKIARRVERCEIVWPVFEPKLRQQKDTDYNDLHARQGLDVVREQLARVIKMIRELDEPAIERSERHGV